MRQNKIQFNVTEETKVILNQLHRFDRARFVELAIKAAYNNKKLRQNFIWNELTINKHDNNNVNEILIQSNNNVSKTEKQSKNNVKPDNIKDPKIDNRW